MKMKSFICSVINGMLCYWVGLWFGKRGGFSRVRACINIFKNGDGYLRSNTIEDDIRMFSVICLHLKNEGYNMDSVKDAFNEAMQNGSPLHEVEE